jgi:hypothetical protein
VPNSPNAATDIQQLIDKIIPELAIFIVGRRVSSGDNMNYQIALLCDSLKKLSDGDREKILSQSVYGVNITGGFLSFLKKNAGLKLSITLGEAIGRYYDIILENNPDEEFKRVFFSDDLGKKFIKTRDKELHREFESDSEIKIQLAFRNHSIRNKKPLSRRSNTESEHTADPAVSDLSGRSSSSDAISIIKARASLPKVDKKATLAMLGGFEPTTNMMRNHKIAKALATSSNQHLGKIKKII